MLGHLCWLEIVSLEGRESQGPHREVKELARGHTAGGRFSRQPSNLGRRESDVQALAGDNRNSYVWP